MGRDIAEQVQGMGRVRGLTASGFDGDFAQAPGFVEPDQAGQRCDPAHGNSEE
jgi:hypothetical protein